MEIIFEQDSKEQFTNTDILVAKNSANYRYLKPSIVAREFSLLFFETTISSLDIFVDNILDEIKEGTGRISDEMAIVFVELETDYCQQELTGVEMLYWLNRKAARVADWFVNKATYWLNANALILHTQLQQNLQDHLQVLQSYGDEVAIASLESLNQLLQEYTTKWEHKLQEQVRATLLQQQFFSTLCEQLQYPTWQQDPEQVALQSLCKLSQMYKAKFSELKINLLVHILKKVNYKLLLLLNSIKYQL